MQFSHQNEISKFRELVNSIKTGILITHSDKKQHKGRPMATLQIDENNDLWFFTNEYSEKIEEVSQNNEVTISYADTTGNDYVVVNGNAFVITDKAKIKELWSPMSKTWFPKGLEDKKLTLLKVEPTEVEYWTGSSNKIIIMFKMLSAMLIGKKFRDDIHTKLAIT